MVTIQSICLTQNSEIKLWNYYIVVSMVTRQKTMYYENYSFRQSYLFHSKCWNEYSNGFYGNQTHSSVLQKLLSDILNSRIMAVFVSMVTKQSHLILNSEMIALMVSIINRYVVHYENYSFRQNHLFHYELWNDYSICIMVTRQSHLIDYSNSFYSNQTCSDALWDILF